MYKTITFFILILISFSVSEAQMVNDTVHFDYYQNLSDNDYVNHFSSGYGLSQIQINGITGGCLVTPDSISWGNDNAIYCSRYKPLTGDTTVTSISFKYDSASVKLSAYQRAISIWLQPSADFNHYIIATVSPDKKIELLTYGWNNNPYPLLALHNNHWYNYKLTVVFNSIDEVSILAEVFDLGLSGTGNAVLVNSSSGTITDNVLAIDTSIQVSITGTTYGGASYLDDFSFNGRLGLTNCIDIATSIDDEISGERIAIYPSPASDEVTVVINGALMTTGVAELLSLAGEKIMTFNLNKPATVLDLHDLVAGIYLLRCRLPGQTVISELVVAR